MKKLSKYKRAARAHNKKTKHATVLVPAKRGYICLEGCRP